ncbi:hypothetical protein ACSSS7_006558 [Eimeria intestinalis]
MEGINRPVEGLGGKLNSLQGGPQRRCGVSSGRGRGEREPAKGAGGTKAAEEAAERVGERERSARLAAAVTRERLGRERGGSPAASPVMEGVPGDRLRFREARGFAVAPTTWSVPAGRVVARPERWQRREW